MLTRVLSLGLAAWLLGACAQLPQDEPDAVAQVEPAVAPAPVAKKEKDDAQAPVAAAPAVAAPAEPSQPAAVVEAPPPAPASRGELVVSHP
jgi:uncharacterized membrane protein